VRVGHPKDILSNHVKSLGVYVQVGGGFMVYRYRELSDCA